MFYNLFEKQFLNLDFSENDAKLKTVQTYGAEVQISLPENCY